MNNSLKPTIYNTENELKGKNNVFFLITVLLTLFGLMYQIIVQVIGIPVQLFALISFSLFLLEYVYNKREVTGNETILFSKRIFFFILWALLYFIAKQFISHTNSSNIIGFSISKPAMFVLTLSLIIIASSIYVQFSNSISFVILVRIFTFVLVLNAIFSIRILLVNPNIMRMIAGGYYRVNGFSFSIIGISGYAEIYTASIIFPMIFGSIPLLKGRNKVFSILLSILVTVYVFMSALATAMIIILLGIILVLYFRLSKKKKALLLPIIVLLLAVISNGKIASQALMNTAGIINIPKYDQKIIDIVKSIDSNEATGLVEDRTMRYEKSIESFVSNPIIGIGFDRNSPFEVGDHATVIDIFGTLGILGGLPFVFFIYYSYIICKKRWENTPYFILVKVSFINFIVIASVKSIMSSYPIFLTIVLFIPIIPHYIERLRNNTAQ